MTRRTGSIPGQRRTSVRVAARPATGLSRQRHTRDPPFGAAPARGIRDAVAAHNEHLWRTRRSGWLGHSGGQVEGLVDAERRALRVGPLELLLAEAGAHMAEAIP